MGKINVARVILGGLLAGLIINISEYILNMYVIAAESTAIMERLGLQFPGITPANLLAIGGAWSLVEMIVAAVAGAWLYKESA